MRRYDVKRSQNLPMARQLVSGWVRLKTQVGLTPKPRLVLPQVDPSRFHQVDEEYEWTSQSLENPRACI